MVTYVESAVYERKSNEEDKCIDENIHKKKGVNNNEKKINK